MGLIREFLEQKKEWPHDENNIKKWKGEKGVERKVHLPATPDNVTSWKNKFLPSNVVQLKFYLHVLSDSSNGKEFF